MRPEIAINTPPEAAGTLYEGEVMHARLTPFSHRFSYTVFSMLIDIDRLPALGGLSRLFSVNRFNILSFHEADHIDQRLSPQSAGAYQKASARECGPPIFMPGTLH